MSDRFVMSARQAAELDHALERGGWTPADVKKLSSGDMAALILPVVRGTAKVEDQLPTEMTIKGRTYDILGFLRGDEASVIGHTMVERAKDMSAHLGQDDGEHILKYQNQIPASLRGNVVFVFTGWRPPFDFWLVGCVFWGVGRWLQDWNWLGNGWDPGDRVLRRK